PETRRWPRRVYVGEEEKLRIRVFGGNARLKLFEHVQFGEVSFRVIQIVEIFPTPAKGFAFRVLQATSVHFVLLEDLLVRRGKVFTHHRNQANLGEIACGEGEIRPRPAENVFGMARGSGYVVKGDGTNSENGHRKSRILTFRSQTR